MRPALGDVSHRFKTGAAMKLSWDVCRIRAGPGPLAHFESTHGKNPKLRLVVPVGFKCVPDNGVWGSVGKMKEA